MLHSCSAVHCVAGSFYCGPESVNEVHSISCKLILGARKYRPTICSCDELHVGPAFSIALYRDWWLGDVLVKYLTSDSEVLPGQVSTRHDLILPLNATLERSYATVCRT